jgi:PTH1 family peptidyl-tRNA hydrolase
MKLIVGLGNPGKKYEKTRHNAGAFVVCEFLNLNSPPFGKLKLNKKLKSLISKGELNDEEIIIAFPQTFMNNSGLAVRAIASYYKLEPKDIWVANDEIDLPLGKIRISRDGSAGGHRGVSSVINELKTKNFIRFRVGIATPESRKTCGEQFTPSLSRGTIPAEKFVLQNFSKEEKTKINESAKKIIGAIELALKNGPEKTMNKFN